jgi:hypothetical protein
MRADAAAKMEHVKAKMAQRDRQMDPVDEHAYADERAMVARS